MSFSFRRFSGRFIEGLLYLSGTITTLVVLLIIVFVFTEGLGIFGKKPIEEGYTLVVSKSNPVNEMATPDIKDVFDQKITNWKTLGGQDDSITLFRIDDIGDFFSDDELGESFELLPQRIGQIVDSIPGIIAFVPLKYYSEELGGKELRVDNITVFSFLGGKEWFPTAQPAAQFGVLPLIMGTLWVSLFAILLALPFGLAAAIYLAEIADGRVRSVLKPLIELLAGIPSVVYGFFGLIVIVPLVREVFDLPVGETALSGSIILAIMALPTIITISEDALRTTPRAMKEASLALGATKWQTIYRVTIPYSISGIAAAVILGIGRAIGETMAVLMVTGNAAIIPHALTQPVRTIPATIAAELGEAPQGGIHAEALFALGCILFLITLLINLSVEFVSNRRKTAHI